MQLPPDLRFGLAIVLLGVVMLTADPRVALWLGVLLVLAALSYAQHEGAQTGHSFISDALSVFGFGGNK